MNYDILRIIIGLVAWIILLFIGILILKIINKQNKISVIITSVIAVALSLFIISLPLGERNRFKTLDDAFKYYFPNATIVRKYAKDSYAFIYYEKITKDSSRISDFVYFIHDKSGWNLGKTDALHYGRGKTSNYKDCGSITINKIEEENVTGVYISSIVFSHSKRDTNVITDSYSTNFEMVSDYVAYTYVGIIDELVDDNYTITFNGKEYQPLK